MDCVLQTVDRTNPVSRHQKYKLQLSFKKVYNRVCASDMGIMGQLDQKSSLHNYDFVPDRQSLQKIFTLNLVNFEPFSLT